MAGVLCATSRYSRTFNSNGTANVPQESPTVQKFRPHLSKLFHALFVPLSIYLLTTVKTLAKTPKFKKKLFKKNPKTFALLFLGGISACPCCQCV